MVLLLVEFRANHLPVFSKPAALPLGQPRPNFQSRSRLPSRRPTSSW
ncbi:hypothetical protein CPLU01_15493 [Colletotrichum plurivorum]|uniref:Uncharacterized protein n=1 Tax=Colletotrichum plurivorum TaxID=2175906 RepID=A0A8H6MVB5_9PEZI|nr:hypothetical protein CPLU01_15493 [Colletotrichum plurivorum]